MPNVVIIKISWRVGLCMTSCVASDSTIALLKDRYLFLWCKGTKKPPNWHIMKILKHLLDLNMEQFFYNWTIP